VALFALIIVGVVVGQTWYDWRKDRQNWVLPDWAKGAALGGVLAVTLAAGTSFASAWMEDPAAQWTDSLQLRLLVPEAGLVLVVGTALVMMMRKKRVPWILVFAGVVMAALWFGISLAG
jgi:hypothetical protein